MDMPAHPPTMTVPMTPDTAHFGGTVRGGTVRERVDPGVCRQPVHGGALVTFPASVNPTGTSSMEVGIEVVAEDIRTQAVRHADRGFFAMVAVGDTRRCAAAVVRKPLRREMETRLRATRQDGAAP